MIGRVKQSLGTVARTDLDQQMASELRSDTMEEGLARKGASGQ